MRFNTVRWLKSKNGLKKKIKNITGGKISITILSEISKAIYASMLSKRLFVFSSHITTL